MSASDGSTADYYQLPAGATQLQDLISHRNLNAQDGEIFRAIYRKGRASHSDELRDAKKVLFYARAEVSRLEAINPAPKALPADFGQQNIMEQQLDPTKHDPRAVRFKTARDWVKSVFGEAYRPDDYRERALEAMKASKGNLIIDEFGLQGGPLTRCIGCKESSCEC